MTRICPICRTEYSEVPATSRRDGVGEICSSCGVREALEDAGITGDVVEGIVILNSVKLKAVET